MARPRKPAWSAAAIIGGAAPGVWLGWSAVNGALSPNPVEDLERRTGYAAFIMLTLALSVTPLRAMSGISSIVQARRWLGLWSFAYAVAHLLIFIGVDYGFDFTLIVSGFRNKRFALAGFAAFLLLVPLAVTSNGIAIRWLGSGWAPLQRLIYPAALFASLHFIWLSKGYPVKPYIHAGIIMLLLALRFSRERKVPDGAALFKKSGDTSFYP